MIQKFQTIGLESLDSEVKYTCRTKYIEDDNGVLKPIESMICSRLCFGKGCEQSERSKKIEKYVEYAETMRDPYGGSRYKPSSDVKDVDGNLARSRRRACTAISDYIHANPFDCFVTLTLDGNKIKRDDYAEIIKKLGQFLNNRVKRDGLIYVGVPELHKNGGFHFHFLMNSSALKLLPSGTYTHTAFKKPVKESTLRKHHIPVEEAQPVYNVGNWNLGFSTAIMLYGERGAVARYITKYITKSSEKICGRWYFSGGKLNKPKVLCTNVDIDDIQEYTYEFECAGGKFKVIKYHDNGEAVVNARTQTAPKF